MLQAISPRPKKAFTLLEVVVGMILVASLAVGSLTALSRYQISLRQAERKSQALDAAESLIEFWMDRPQGLPGSDRGLLAGESAMAWQTRLVRQQILGGSSVDVMRLDIVLIEENRVQSVPIVSIEYVRASRASNYGIAAIHSPSGRVERSEGRAELESVANPPRRPTATDPPTAKPQEGELKPIQQQKTVMVFNPGLLA